MPRACNAGKWQGGPMERVRASSVQSIWLAPSPPQWVADRSARSPRPERPAFRRRGRAETLARLRPARVERSTAAQRLGARTPLRQLGWLEAARRQAARNEFA
jgi:hypothetical protein